MADVAILIIFSHIRNCDFDTVAMLLHNSHIPEGPRIGVPIASPIFNKGYGCRHLCKELAAYTKSCYVETKYDGQRMQIHVDLSLPIDKQIQIFSKKGQDSTKRREEIIPYDLRFFSLLRKIRKALGIGCNQRFGRNLVLDGELVLWDEEGQRITEFHELGAHLSGLGFTSCIEKTNCSDANRHLHLMAVFFDVLMYDDKSLLDTAYVDRTRLLAFIIHAQPGEAILPNRFHLNLHPLESAINSLQNAMSRAIAAREEGLIIKPANSTYFGNPHWFKLKKDHIKGLGDTLDFVLVGTGFSEERALTVKKEHSSKKWNVWHLACLENKDEVEREVRCSNSKGNSRTQNRYFLLSTRFLTAYDHLTWIPFFIKPQKSNIP